MTVDGLAFRADRWRVFGIGEKLGICFDGVLTLAHYAKAEAMMTYRSDGRAVATTVRRGGDALWSGQAWFEMSVDIAHGRKRRPLNYQAFLISNGRLRSRRSAPCLACRTRYASRHGHSIGKPDPDCRWCYGTGAWLVRRTATSVERRPRSPR